MLRRLILGAIALPVLAAAALYAFDPAVPARYLSLFLPEDGHFDSLRPRELIDGSRVRQVPAAAAGDLSIEPAALAEMQRYAAEQDSWALIVIHRGRIQAEWYAPGWDRQRLTQSQSMHKSVLPLLVGAAIQDGAIASVDEPVARYLPEWAGDARGTITLEQLLTMSSGLLEYPFSLNPFSDAFRWLFGGDTTPVLLRTPLAWEPGSRFEYNNVNAELLGLIIERATGQRYADYLRTALWDPMGGEHAELWLDAAGGKAHSSCCLLAPAMDWARFGLLLLEEGRIADRQVVDGDFLKRIITPSANSEWYGYQIWLGYSRAPNPRAEVLAGGYRQSEPFAADDTFYASGFGAQRVYVVPSARLVIVRMGPSSGRTPVKPSWDNTFLVNTALRNLRDPAGEAD